MSPIILEARQVTKRYGQFTALNGVDLKVHPNTVHSVIGPNGAGKTTLFHMLTGTVPITSGSIFLDTEDISKLSDFERVKKGVARSFQVTSLFLNLSVRENIRLAAQGVRAIEAFNLWQRPEAKRKYDGIIDATLERVGLSALMSKPAHTLSHGQQRRLEVGMALAAQPKIIFLDEPTSGMGIDDIQSMKELIHHLGQQLTVVLIEHNMDIVMDISDRVTVMQQGKVLVEGLPDYIRANPEVQQAYLGSMITGGKKHANNG